MSLKTNKRNRRVLLFLSSILLLVSVFMMTNSPTVNAADRGVWAPNVSYVVGDTVTYNGATYTCLQSHTSLVGWEPSNVPALWKSGGGGSSPTATPTATKTSTPTSSPSVTPTPTVSRTPTATPTATRTTTPTPTSTNGTYPAWTYPHAYAVNDIISYNGVNYQCIQAHTSNVAWTPDVTPTLWKVYGGGSTPTPTTTRTATPTATSTPVTGKISAIYGGGPFYSGGTSVMNDLRSSGFTTVILWTIHVDGSGNLTLNDVQIVSNGAYIGNSAWPSQLATLKQAPTSVNRIEISVGSWGVNDFQSIQSLIASQGTSSGSILYRNFQALKNALGADAIDLDDETLYDVNSTVQFGNMLATMGYKITLCPYTNSGYWSSVKSQLGGKVDRVYLQCYSGGAGNDPGAWNNIMGMTVIPGLWCLNASGGDSPSSVQSKITSWRSSAGITGGFMWLYDDMQKYGPSTSAYANAINNALK